MCDHYDHYFPEKKWPKPYQGKINKQVDSILKQMGFTSRAVATCWIYNTGNIALHVYEHTKITDLPRLIYHEGKVNTAAKIKDVLFIAP